MAAETTDLFADSLVLLHNPRCSKSRAAKVLLAERGVSFVERKYLEHPLSAAELTGLHARLGRPVIEWTRRNESGFAAAGLTATSSDAAIIAAIADTPALLERPIRICGDRAVVGRPPEDILALL
jgi:arsenate reductase